MLPADHARYQEILGRVEREVSALRSVLFQADAASRERVWLKGTEGELDDGRIVDALAGESAVFKRRSDRRPRVGDPPVRPKRLLFLFDLSASMVRFNADDARMTRSIDCAAMLMEALSGFERKFEWSFCGHSGDDRLVELVPFARPPADAPQRLKVLDTMQAHAEFCGSGDNTVESLRAAADRVAQRDASGPADDRLVFAFSDANLEQYAVTVKDLDAALRHKPGVRSTLIFLAASDGEARRITEQLPPGKAYLALELRHLPTLLKGIFAASVTGAAPPRQLRSAL